MQSAKRNLRGGKSFKKAKKPTETGGGRDGFSQREEGQDYGRVLAMLGDRRVRCFCNDGVERICKIRSRLCKRPHKKIISVGDIVLITPRVFGVPGSDSEDEPVAAGGGGLSNGMTAGSKGVWDLIDKAEKSDWRQIRKEDGIHKHLFGVTAETESADIFDKTNEDEDEEIDVDNI